MIHGPSNVKFITMKLVKVQRKFVRLRQTQLPIIFSQYTIKAFSWLFGYHKNRYVLKTTCTSYFYNLKCSNTNFRHLNLHFTFKRYI